MDRCAVVIPLFNHARYVEAAVASVLGQSRPPERLIIIDDGSTDQSVEIVRSITDPRITLVEQANAGAHNALNRGIALAEDCEFVAILNSDDIHLPHRLETVLKAMAADDKWNLAVTSLELIDADGALLAPEEPRARWFRAVWSPLGTEKPLPEWLGMANFPATTSNFVARRRWLLNNPMRDYRYAHDYHALVRAALRDELLLLPDVLLQYRVHAANTITTAPEKLTSEMIRVQLDIAAEFGPQLQRDAELRARYAAHQRSLWRNVSGIRRDVLECLSAAALGALGAPQLAALASQANTEQFPELAVFPNKSLVNELPEGAVLGGGFADEALGERLAELKKDIARTKQKAAALLQLTQTTTLLAASRWAALGRVLGVFKIPGNLPGKDPDAKILYLLDLLRRSWWIKAGSIVGSRSAPSKITTTSPQ